MLHSGIERIRKHVQQTFYVATERKKPLIMFCTCSRVSWLLQRMFVMAVNLSPINARFVIALGLNFGAPHTAYKRAPGPLFVYLI